MPFSENSKENKEICRNLKRISALIPVLHEVQSEYGWLSTESMKETLRSLEFLLQMFRTLQRFILCFTKPVGKHIIWQRNAVLRSKGAGQVEHYLAENWA
jgi:NADH:ubiquinone oxidoreductase subunit E